MKQADCPLCDAESYCLVQVCDEAGNEIPKAEWYICIYGCHIYWPTEIQFP